MKLEIELFRDSMQKSHLDDSVQWSHFSWTNTSGRIARIYSKFYRFRQPEAFTKTHKTFHLKGKNQAVRAEKEKSVTELGFLLRARGPVYLRFWPAYWTTNKTSPKISNILF